MLTAKLLAIVSLLVSASAVPLHQPAKRALPRLGGINLAVSVRPGWTVGFWD